MSCREFCSWPPVPENMLPEFVFPSPASLPLRILFRFPSYGTTCGWIRCVPHIWMRPSAKKSNRRTPAFLLYMPPDTSSRLTIVSVFTHKKLPPPFGRIGADGPRGSGLDLDCSAAVTLPEHCVHLPGHRPPFPFLSLLGV